MKKGILISIVVFFVFSTIILNAQLMPITGYIGGDIKDIGFINEQEFFIATQQGGIQKTTDGGVTFFEVSDGFTNQTLFNNNFFSLYVDGNNIYAGGGSNNFVFGAGLQVSTDGGATWDFKGLEGRNINDILKHAGKILCATQGSGLQSFENDALSPMNNGFGSTNIRALYTDWNDDLFAAADDGLYKYDEAVELWELLVTGFTPIGFAKDEFNENFLASEDQIFVTTNFVDFIPLNTLDIGENYSFTSIEVSGTFLYATLVPDDFESDIPQLYVYDLITGDWASDIEGLHNPGLVQIFKILGNNKHLGTSHGFYKGLENGPLQNVTEVLTAGIVTALSYDEVENYIYVGGGNGSLWVFDRTNNQLTKNDEGLNYTQIQRIIPTTHGLYVAHSNGINFQPSLNMPFTSKDNGISSGINDLAYNPINDVLAASTNNGIFSSADAGENWSQTNVTEYTNQIDFSNSQNKFYAATLSNVVSSDGDGQNFETFVQNVASLQFKIRESDWKIGVAAFDDFYEIDPNGSLARLGYAEFGGDGFADKIEWSINLNRWLGSRDNKIYSFNIGTTNWEHFEETDEAINIIHRVTLSFKNKSGLLQNDVTLVGTLGGGLYSSGTLTDINNDEGKIITNYKLAQNYPNPFNPATKVKYSIPISSLVTIKIFDVLGKEIATLVNEEKPMGNFEVNFDASSFSSGVYFYKIKAGEYVDTKKMILIK